MFKTIVLLSFLAAINAQLNNTSCVRYYNPCSGTSNADSQNCCNYPAVICLPDAQNGTSCLSPLDLINISPEVTGLSILEPLFEGMQNASKIISDLVEINGQTVFNRTSILTPSTTMVYNG